MKKILCILLLGILGMQGNVWGIGNAFELKQAIDTLNKAAIESLDKAQISGFITSSPSLLNAALIKAANVSAQQDKKNISEIISYLLDIILENRLNKCFETKTIDQSYLDILKTGLNKDAELFNEIIRAFASKFENSPDKETALAQLKSMQSNITNMSKKSKQAIKSAITKLEKASAETPEVAQLKDELGQLKTTLNKLQGKVNLLNTKLVALQTKL